MLSWCFWENGIWAREIKGCLYKVTFKVSQEQTWLVWLSWLGTVPQIERSQVQFPVRAHAWVVGSVPGWDA